MAITNQDLNETAEAQGVEVRRGDFVIVRTGHDGPAAARRANGAATPAATRPGLAFETAEWIYEQGDRGDLLRHLGLRGPSQRDRPTHSQPWHWVVIPMIGISMGEIFVVDHAGRRLHRGRRLRVLLLRAAAADHPRRRLAPQPHRDQVKQDAAG